MLNTFLFYIYDPLPLLVVLSDVFPHCTDHVENKEF